MMSLFDIIKYPLEGQNVRRILSTLPLDIQIAHQDRWAEYYNRDAAGKFRRHGSWSQEDQKAFLKQLLLEREDDLI